MARVRDLSGNGGRGGVGVADPELNPVGARPGLGLLTIVPSDTEDQMPGSLFQGFMVNGTGDVAIIDETGTSHVLSSIPVATQIAQRVKRFLATGTTATGIKGIL